MLCINKINTNQNYFKLFRNTYEYYIRTKYLRVIDVEAADAAISIKFIKTLVDFSPRYYLNCL